MSSQKFFENHVKMLDEFLLSAATKKFRFDCQKAINIPVNAISGINQQHLKDKYERLYNLLMGKSCPDVNQYPQGAAFCKNILAKKIVVCNNFIFNLLHYKMFNTCVMYNLF